MTIANYFFEPYYIKYYCKHVQIYLFLVFCRWRWLSGTILASLVLDSTGFWVRISARTPILRNITTGEISQEGFTQGFVFPPATSRYRGSVRIIFRGTACVSEWMLISVKKKDGGLVFHNLRLHKDSKLE
jgi:hypothetical protein